jgi:hypothetical protein
MRVLFIFLDGVGLGEDDPEINPFARAEMPQVTALLDGRKLIRQSAPFHGDRASLLSLDASLGVQGFPQSATGQASLLTGRNVPAELGYHYGPKPNPAVAEFLKDGTLFKMEKDLSGRVDFLNAYPPRYFQSIESGRRLYSAIPLAAVNAGLKLHSQEDLMTGRALSADLTGHGWREHLGISDSPVYTPAEAGVRLASLARQVNFSFFEYWLTDYAGHGQNMDQALQLLATLDGVFGSLASVWEDKDGLALVTSDHGNMEDLSTRRHTANPVPCLLFGSLDTRRRFADDLADLAGLGRHVKEFLRQDPNP